MIGMNPALLSLFGVSALTLLPVSISEQQAVDTTGTCGARITMLEDEVSAATGSGKAVHFIETNTTAFKSLSQKYTLYWISTKYRWDNDLSNCSAKLENITASFQIANSTRSYIGVAHVTVDPALTKVIGMTVDIPNTARH